MLTKEIAIARLRATGTLGSEDKATTVISATDAKAPIARMVSNVLLSNARTRGVRMVAAGANQAVLP